MLKHALPAFLLLLAIAPQLAQADQVQLLTRGDQSLGAFYGTIQGAKTSIDLATFVFESCDSVPKLVLDALVKKAQSGVKVRLLIDAYSLTEPTRSSLPAYVAGMKNFQLRYYNDSLGFFSNNMRSHAKSLVVDGATYIVGGRNMQDDYFGLGAKMNYVDHDLLVTGGSAGVAQSEFNELWSASASDEPVGLGDSRKFAATCLKVSDRDAQVAAFARDKAPAVLAGLAVRSCAVKYALDYPDFATCGNCLNHDGNPPADGDYLNDERLDRKRATGLVLDFLQGAKTKIEAVNQYYLPFLRVDYALASLRKRHVSVDVISNATGDIDDPRQNKRFTCFIQSSAVRTAVGSQQVSLLTSKGALGTPWELSVGGAPWRIHAKSAIRDDADVLVSSFNLDPRSYSTNLESGAVVTGCPDLAKDLEAAYAGLRAQVAADKSCKACSGDFLPDNQDPHAWCGLTPTLF